MTHRPDESDSQSIIESLRRMDERISRLEEHLGFQHPRDAVAREADRSSQTPRQQDALEFRIGQYWAARAGIVLLVVGFAFLLTFPFESAPSGLIVGLGLAITASLFGLWWIARRSFPHFAHCLLGGGLFLLYFSVLRLHFFAGDPLVSSRSVEVSLLCVAVIIAFIIAIRAQSVYLASLAGALGYATAIASELDYFCLAALLIFSIVSLGLSLRLSWHKSVAAAIVMTYLTHAIWVFGNPVMTGEFHLLSPPKVHLIFLLAYCAVFAMASLFRAGDGGGEIEFIQAFLNGVGGYALYALCSTAMPRYEAAIWQLPPSALLLMLASLFWVRRHSRSATFVYAMLGYGAMTLAIAFATSGSRLFLLLCWQSILVLATSLWFRSKFIVLANFMIYTGVLLFYLLIEGRPGWVGLSFGVVALLSARVLNWQKDRLELRTELMRNSYLTVAFFIIPFTLWWLMPRKSVALSWLALGVAYYILSLLLRNKKYRWMALLTMLVTVLYVAAIGIVQLEPVYRIVSFVAVGSALLVISLVYGRSRLKRENAEPQQDRS